MKKEFKAAEPTVLLNRYRVTAVTMAGAFGGLFQAYDTVRERPVFLATLKRERPIEPRGQLSYSPQQMDQDVQATTALAHPSVLAFCDLHDGSSQHILVSDFTEYAALNRNPAFLARSGLCQVVDTFNSVVHMAQYMARSKAYGAMLRPDNVYVSNTGEVKVANYLMSRLTLLARYPDLGSREKEVLSNRFGAFADRDAIMALDMSYLGQILEAMLCLGGRSKAAPGQTPAEATEEARLAEEVQPKVREMLRKLGAGTYPDLDAFAAETATLAGEVAAVTRKEEVVTFRARADKRTLLPGDILFRDGDTANGEAYIVEKGLVHVIKTAPDGKEFYLDSSKAGEIIGEMALIDNKPRMATVKAVEPTTLLVVTAPYFKAMIEKSDMVSQKVIQVLTQRLRYQAGEIARLKSLLGGNR